MKEWWKQKKSRTRKHRKNQDKYTFLDFIVDALFWIPEIILIPFRVIFWLIRGLWRFLDLV